MHLPFRGLEPGARSLFEVYLLTTSSVKSVEFFVCSFPVWVIEGYVRYRRHLRQNPKP
jgi:hypothetical protein